MLRCYNYRLFARQESSFGSGCDQMDTKDEMVMGGTNTRIGLRVMCLAFHVSPTKILGIYFLGVYRGFNQITISSKSRRLLLVLSSNLFITFSHLFARLRSLQ